MTAEDEAARAAAQFEAEDLGRRMAQEFADLITSWGQQLGSAINAYPDVDVTAALPHLARLLREAADIWDPPQGQAPST